MERFLSNDGSQPNTIAPVLCFGPAKTSSYGSIDSGVGYVYGNTFERVTPGFTATHFPNAAISCPGTAIYFVAWFGRSNRSLDVIGVKLGWPISWARFCH